MNRLPQLDFCSHARRADIRVFTCKEGGGEVAEEEGIEKADDAKRCCGLTELIHVEPIKSAPRFMKDFYYHVLHCQFGIKAGSVHSFG